MKKNYPILTKIAVLFALVGLVAGTIAVTNNLNTNTSSITARAKKTKLKQKFDKPAHTDQNAKRIFLNASENKNGNTAQLAKKVFGKQAYKQINLTDYHIPQIGQGDGDFKRVWEQLKGADIILIGTPVYWSNMSGYLKTFIDHLQINSDLQGRDLYVIVQGTDADQTLAINSTYGTLNRVAKRFGLNFVGLAQTDRQAHRLHQKMTGQK